MQAKIIQSFENAGALGEVNRFVEGATPDYQLMTEVRRFQLVQTPELAAEIEISAKLAGSDGHILAARVFSAKEPAQSKDEAEAARALSTAFGSIVSGLMSWTRETIADVAAKEATAKEPVIEPVEIGKAEIKERKHPAHAHEPRQ